jgi:hypothetical protein
MDIKQWQKMSSAEQIGNIGSEISRAKKKKDALWRALGLIDLTLSQYPSKELCRLREVVCDIIVGSKFYEVDLDELISFCLPFAVLARKHL